MLAEVLLPVSFSKLCKPSTVGFGVWGLGFRVGLEKPSSYAGAVCFFGNVALGLHQGRLTVPLFYPFLKQYIRCLTWELSLNPQP